MAGRDKNPGETGSHGGLRDYQQYMNRAERCIISTVNPENGIVQACGETIAGKRDLTAPVLWFTANGRQSAWGRYMPMGSERCHVLYRKDGTAFFLNYDATLTKDDKAGWPELTAAQKAGDAGFRALKTLKRGEFDFKSSGNAYIFGSNTGTLLLSGGQAFIKLDNQAYRMESKAAEFHQTSSASQTRFGIVFRKLTPADMAETQVPPGTFSEFLVDLNDANPATGLPLNPLQSKAKLHFGDILDPVVNTPTMSLKTGLPLRGLISLGDTASATEVFRLEIDQTGDVVWTQGPTGVLGLDMTMMKFNATIATDATVTCPLITFNAATSYSVTSPLVSYTAATSYGVTSPSVSFTAAASFGVTSPSILLGGAGAIHPIILSTTYRASEDILFTVLNTVLTALGIALSAAGADPSPAGWAAAAPILQVIGGTISAAIPTAFTAFSVASPTYLSLVSKTI